MKKRKKLEKSIFDQKIRQVHIWDSAIWGKEGQTKVFSSHCDLKIFLIFDELVILKNLSIRDSQVPYL